MKKAFVTGITGQDGAFLSQLLLENGYQVFGGARRSASGSLWRLDKLGIKDQVEIIDFELTDQENVTKVIRDGQFDEVYNLGAMSFVGSSFRMPIATQHIDYLGVFYIIEAIRHYSEQTRFYQASTSEMFGEVQEVPQKETTPFHPRSPYGVAKLAAHWALVNYRESYDLHLTSGILFNHESELRGSEFVTKKITEHVGRYYADKSIKPLELGNLESKRDWGFAGDYVKGIYLMLQQEKADDYVLATGETNTVRSFVENAFAAIDVEIEWNQGQDPVDETGVDKKTGDMIVKINPKFFRPAEVDLLIGDPSKAKADLGWEPELGFSSLLDRMVKAEIA
jgi:GDPmannose 4,6-dehydratase